MKHYLLIISTLFAVSSFAQTGTITTFAGTGAGTPATAGDGGPATAAVIPNGSVFGVFNQYGDMFFSQHSNHSVRKISTAGIISTIAGTGSFGYAGDGGPATAAKFFYPTGTALDSAGNLYICDSRNCRIRRINTSTGIITTFAGNGSSIDSGDGGGATVAGIKAPQSLCFDLQQNMYITEASQYIRKIDAITGIIHTLAGNGYSGYSGDGGPSTAAIITNPYGICADSAGNIYFAELGCRIRRIDGTTGIITTVAGTGTTGVYNGEGLPATAANINPYDVRLDADGNLIFGDNYNCRVRMVTTTDTVFTIAGTGTYSYSGDGGPSTAANIRYPHGIMIDDCNNIYFPDEGNARIRKISYSTRVHPSISIRALLGNPPCYSMPVTFSSAVTRGGPSPAYQWLVNGVPSGSGSSFTYTPTNGDNVRCVLTTSLYCMAGDTAGSNVLHMVVDTFTPPVITLAGPAVASPGSSVTVTAAISGGLGTYQLYWYNRGAPMGITTVPAITYTKTAANDSITATLVSNARSCYDSATSNLKVVGLPLAVAPLAHSPTITCYPNPATEQLNIACPEPITEIIVTDLPGRQVLNGASPVLDISTLPKGFYLVKVNNRFTGKFLKK